MPEIMQYVPGASVFHRLNPLVKLLMVVLVAVLAVTTSTLALLALAEECSLSPAEARERTARVVGAVAGWRDAARRNGIREQEITMMADSIVPRVDAVIAAARKA